MKTYQKAVIGLIALCIGVAYLPILAQAQSDGAKENKFMEDAMVAVEDPLAPWNESMFWFNDLLYTAVWKPLTTGYHAVTPSFLRTGIKNFFRNLGGPARMLSCILQGKGRAAGSEANRFIINTVAGLGFFDHVPELTPPEEDLGQTLANLGMGPGFYIVWPVFGPSTLRDTIGMVGDRFLDPATYVEPWEDAATISMFERINSLSFRLGDYEAFMDAAIDPYESMKDAYMQNRIKDIKE